MADALLLVSQRVKPTKLEQSGYRFAQPELPAALTEVFRKQ
jgi:NAD dependent epimerase/dehydratase family enzyme